jgi:hypothetical protein
MRLRKQAAARDRQQRALAAERSELEGYVDHGQTGPHQQQGIVWPHLRKGVGRPGVGDESGTVVEPGVGTARASGGEVAGGQDDEVGVDLATVGEPQAPPRRVEDADRLAANGDEAGARPGGQGLHEARLEVVAEEPTRREGGLQVSAALLERRGQSPRGRRRRLQPVPEPGRQADLHPADRHI